MRIESQVSSPTCSHPHPCSYKLLIFRGHGSKAKGKQEPASGFCSLISCQTSCPFSGQLSGKGAVLSNGDEKARPAGGCRQPAWGAQLGIAQSCFSLPPSLPSNSWHPGLHFRSFPHLVFYVFGPRGCRFKSSQSLDHVEGLLLSVL
uniref:Uncharacterized protein n=1 Tax=Myotis myotis TaxID=51298 RepID=A0A7J7RL45_MYOMY|nr:hypothetical protein mMyoMyo1_010301 [Myotis myotis]